MADEEPNWPYEHIEALEHEPEPTWDCPTGICHCAEVNEHHEGWQFSVMLCEADGRRMRGARCRVVINGMLANEDDPYADGEGWITVVTDHAPASVLVEWAPPDTPKRAPYPYRHRYYVDLREDDADEAARRRLHNLGFSVMPSLRHNVEDFQGQYGRPITGEVADIEDDLRVYHDEAMVPIRRRQKQSDIQLARFAPGDEDGPVGGPPEGQPKATPQPPPAPPPDKGKPHVSAPGKGTAKSPVSPELILPTVVEVFDRHDGVYQFAPVPVREGKTLGLFWMMVDAFKDKKSGLRLPCRAAENQKIADAIKFSQKQLPAWDDDRVTSEDEPLPCLMLTMKLMARRYQWAKKQRNIVDPCPEDVAGLLIVESRRMNKEIDDQLKALGASPGQWVADPGKIWAIENGMSDDGSVAVNYGWHVEESKLDRNGKFRGIDVSINAAVPGMKCLQSVGYQHSAYHIDYSQILLLVAGWCQVAGPEDDRMHAMKTADVYKSKKFAPLVARDSLPLRLTKQPFSESSLAAEIDMYWKKQEGIYRSGSKAKRGAP
jgi:hypothetical protein